MTAGRSSAAPAAASELLVLELDFQRLAQVGRGVGLDHHDRQQAQVELPAGHRDTHILDQERDAREGRIAFPRGGNVGEVRRPAFDHRIDLRIDLCARLQRRVGELPRTHLAMRDEAAKPDRVVLHRLDPDADPAGLRVRHPVAGAAGRPLRPQAHRPDQGLRPCRGLAAGRRRPRHRRAAGRQFRYRPVRHPGAGHRARRRHAGPRKAKTRSALTSCRTSTCTTRCAMASRRPRWRSWRWRPTRCSRCWPWP